MPNGVIDSTVYPLPIEGLDLKSLPGFCFLKNNGIKSKKQAPLI